MLRKTLFTAACLLATSAACAHTEEELRQAAHALLWGSGTSTQTFPDPLAHMAEGLRPLLRPLDARPLADAPRFRAREHRPFAAFEYDVVNKGFDKREVYASMWKHALRVCEAQNGYVTEYHAGYKRFLVDTKEAGLRERAYATCAVEPAPEAPSTEALPLPDVTLVEDALSVGGEALAVSAGSKRPAYEAARDLAYQACLDRDRRVDRMSVGFNDGERRRVMLRFACSVNTFGD